ncbi:MAG: HAD hydrolase family protein [Lachnospiraceae bacterium]|nr:HAD hydrolase family protein [Lachnospiraceae bacterium]
MKRKYFFFDIDDTLTVRFGNNANEAVIPDSAREALRLLEEKGHFLAICTGRSHSMAEPFRQRLGFQNMVHDGGNGVTLDGKLIEILPLDREAVLALFKECDEKGIAWGFNPDDSIRRLTPDPRFYEITKDAYMKTEVVPGLDPNDYPEFHKAYAAIRPGEEGLLRSLRQLPWLRYQDEYIFIEPTNKAAGIRRMLEMIGGDPKEVVVFGDNWNDISMFSSEWTNIAMGNAIPRLKELADYVTSKNSEDGIYNACLHFGWIP